MLPMVMTLHKSQTTTKIYSTPCIFLGYSPTQYTYQCLDLTTNKIYTSKHTIFPYPSLIPNNQSQPTPYTISNQLSHLILSIANPIPPTMPSPQWSPSSTIMLVEPLSSLSFPGNDSPPLSLIQENHVSANPVNTTIVPNHTYSMIKRSQKNIFKLKRAYTTSKHPLLENTKPSNV